MSKFLREIIKFYQKTFSPQKGIFKGFLPEFFGCRFSPTCSEYALEAIEKYGTIKGCFLGIKRIMRCNPFSDGGYDPLPYSNNK